MTIVAQAKKKKKKRYFEVQTIGVRRTDLVELSLFFFPSFPHHSCFPAVLHHFRIGKQAQTRIPSCE